MPADKGLEDELLGLQCIQKNYGFRIDHEAGGYSDRGIALGMAALVLATTPGSIVGKVEAVLRDSIFPHCQDFIENNNLNLEDF